MSKKAAAKERVFKLPEFTSRNPRNFWADGFTGVSSPDGKNLTRLRRFSGGGREILAGFDVELYMRRGVGKLGAVRVAWVEGRAQADGTLTLEIYTEGKGGRKKRLAQIVGHRYGVDTTQEVPNEAEPADDGESEAEGQESHEAGE